MANLLCTDCGNVFNDHLNACPECGNPASECTRVQEPQPQAPVQPQPQPQPQVQPVQEQRPVETTVIQPAQPVQQPKAVKTSHTAAEVKDGNLLEKLDRDWAHYVYECGVICWDCFTSKLFAFNGRASRREFWSFVLISPLVLFGVSLVYGLLTGIGNLLAMSTNSFELIKITATLSAFIGFLLGLWWLIALIAVSVRRMHDVNLNSWWILVPVASLFLYLKKSDSGTNNYGEPSKIYFDQY